MSPIRRLPQVLVDQIAAGEVVERPASVVKELVENALDAGAGRIEVLLAEGGRRAIEVRDDGCGIPAEELVLAVTSHATSKIAGPEDLRAIATLGFRGEALASIGAVSRLHLVSRPHDAPAAAEVEVRFGRLGAVRAAAGAPGTRVVVEDLFAEVPARLQFLRQPSTELAHAAAWVERLGLSHEGVAFALRHDGRALLDVAAGDDLEARCAAVFGRGLAERMVAVAEDRDVLRLRARVGPPESVRADPGRVHLFLNGRWIRDPRLLRAVREGVREFAPDGGYPALVLFLAVPPERADVNVHPQKLEVRFRDDRLVFAAVAGALRRGLGRSQWAARSAGSVGWQVAEPLTRPPAEHGAGPPPAAPPPDTTLVNAAESVGPVLQVANTYLVREVPGGMEILDQHALHERVNLEELRREWRRSGVVAQPLLVPAVVDVSREEFDLLARWADVFRSLGVELEAFGPGAVSVRAVPSLLDRLVPERLVHDLLDVAREHREAAPAALADEVLRRMACRGAVSAGDRLDGEMLENLLRRGARLPQDRTCAHGRPVRVLLSLQDLERAFHRR